MLTFHSVLTGSPLKILNTFEKQPVWLRLNMLIEAKLLFDTVGYNTRPVHSLKLRIDNVPAKLNRNC